MIRIEGRSRRHFFGFAAGVLFFAGCATIQPTVPVSLEGSSSQNFIGTGKVLLTQPGHNHSGDLYLLLAESRQLRLRIFTPLIGTLIYEVRADATRLMILDYQEGWYVLEENTEQSRRKWLGMDLSLEELGWLLQGGKTFSTQEEWRIIGETPERMSLSRGETELKIRFDSLGRIRRLEKQVEGLPEYELEISKYLEGPGALTPRRLRVTDFSGSYQLLLVFSEVHRPLAFKQPFSFEAPENLTPYRPES